MRVVGVGGSCYARLRDLYRITWELFERNGSVSSRLVDINDIKTDVIIVSGLIYGPNLNLYMYILYSNCTCLGRSNCIVQFETKLYSLDDAWL